MRVENALLMLCSSLLSVAVNAAGPVKVRTETRDGVHLIIATNSSAAPYQLAISLTEATNISVGRQFPVDTVLPRHTETTIATVRGADKRQSHRFKYQYSYRYGDPKATHDPKAVYRLPFENGKHFTIGQAWGGRLTTHNSIGSRYAVDIPMPVGTTLVAARSGIVTDVVRPFSDGKKMKEYMGKSNYVRILHSDGTWAEYAHLQRFTSNIYPGQWVDAGTPIGLSGNSGYSSGPHLHFVVQKNNGTETVAVPFRFSNISLGTFDPKPGLLLIADYGRSGARAYITTGNDPRGGASGPRSLRECMGPKKEIDNQVVQCVTGGQ